MSNPEDHEWQYQMALRRIYKLERERDALLDAWKTTAADLEKEVSKKEVRATLSKPCGSLGEEL